MLRMILVSFLFGVGTLWGVTHPVRAYGLMLWNNIFRPVNWARGHGILDASIFPSHLFCAGLFVLTVFVRPWKRRWNLGAFALLCLMGWMWVCQAFSPFPEIAQAEALRATKYLLPALIASLALVDRSKQLTVIYILAFSVGIHSAWAGVHATFIRGDIEIAMSIRGGQMTDRNDFLAGATGCLPLLALVGWHYVGRYARLVRPIAKGMIFTTLLAFLWSASRGAFVGLCALGLFYSAVTGRFWRRTSVVLLLAVFVLAAAPDAVWRRLSTIELGTEQTEGSAKIRLEHMTAAVQMTFDNPIVGVGPDAFPYESMKYGELGADPHFFWLKCSAEYGLVGLAGLLLMLFVLTRRLLRVAKLARLRDDRQTEALATAICCAYIGFLATGTFLSQFLSEYFWSMIGLAGAFLAFEERNLREAATQASDLSAANARKAGDGVDPVRA